MLVMTFNLASPTPWTAPTNGSFAGNWWRTIIRRRRPDLLGTQEGTVPMLAILAANLPEYLPLTAHRQVDETCQYPTIFYRAEGFSVKESGEFWLSQTPEVHRSRSWDSAFPRLATYGLFRRAG